MELIDYEAAIAPLLARFEADDLDHACLGVLADLLGCTYIFTHYDNDRAICMPEQPAANCETVAHPTLMSMLHTLGPARDACSYEERIVLLGLAQNERWATCLKNEDAAYEFASTILRFLSSLHLKRGVSYAAELHRNATLEAVQPMLHQWLKPVDPTIEYVSRSFASAVFGEPWCALVLDDLRETVLGNDIVTASRPPFLPGLLDCEMSTDAPAILPHMEH